MELWTVDCLIYFDAVVFQSADCSNSNFKNEFLNELVEKTSNFCPSFTFGYLSAEQIILGKFDRKFDEDIMFKMSKLCTTNAPREITSSRFGYHTHDRQNSGLLFVETIIY